MPVITNPPYQQVKQAVEISEASMELEGFDTVQSPLYCDLRDRVLTGEIDFDQAVNDAVHTLSRNARISAA